MRLGLRNLLVGLSLLLIPTIAYSQSGMVWDGNFETNVTDISTLVMDLDSRINEIKADSRHRIETEMCVGSGFVGSGTNCTAADDGRLREGACRAFFQAAAPTQIAVDDDDASNALDDGRVWTDSDDFNRLYVYDNGAGAFEYTDQTNAALVTLTGASFNVPNTTWTSIQYDNEVYDDDDWSDISAAGPNPQRLTIPTGVTEVRVTCGISWDVGLLTQTAVRILKNGASYPGISIQSSAILNAGVQHSSNVVSPLLRVVATDYFVCQVWQTSGAAATIDALDSTYFAIEAIY